MRQKRMKIEVLAMRPSYRPSGDVETIIAMAVHIADENRDIWSQSWKEISEEEREGCKAEARFVLTTLTEAGYAIEKSQKAKHVEPVGDIETIIATAIYENDGAYTSDLMRPYVMVWRREEARAAMSALIQNQYEIRKS